MAAMRLTDKELDIVIGLQHKIDAILAAVCNRNHVSMIADSDEPILNALCRITADCEEIIERNDLLINKVYTMVTANYQSQKGDAHTATNARTDKTH